MSTYPKGVCSCGCGVTGALGSTGHARRCTCASCRGRRNRRRGKLAEQSARRVLAPATPHGHGGHEETWRGAWRVEVKAGAQVGPAITRWRSIEAQADAARAADDLRPLVAVLSPSGRGAGEPAVMLSLADWLAVQSEIAEARARLVGADERARRMVDEIQRLTGEVADYEDGVGNRYGRSL